MTDRILAIFLIAGRTQYADASSVAAAMPKESCVFLDVATGLGFSPEKPIATDLHIPKTTARGLMAARQELLAVRRLGRGKPPPKLVFGQDLGTPQRLVIAMVKRWKWPTVLMPDGIVFEPPTTVSRGEGGKALLRELARHSGLLAGDGHVIGSSRPDVICSWGAAWEAYWARYAPTSTIVHTGAPRMAAYARLPAAPGAGRLLVCSQPLALLGATPEEIRAWYRNLLKLARADSDRIRVRLHPAEQTGSGGDEALTILRDENRGSPLSDDLEWADAVAAPCSTVLLEAAAAGRRILLAHACASLPELWQRSPFFRALSTAQLFEPAAIPDVSGLPAMASVAGEFLRDSSTAPARVAEILRSRW